MHDIAIPATLRLWDYTVSHAVALFRRPATPSVPENLDLIFSGVSYLALPTTLDHPTITMGSVEDLADVAPSSVPTGSRLFVIRQAGQTHYVIAAGLSLEENRRDLFDPGTHPNSPAFSSVTLASWPGTQR
jgi:hypothetical protein